MAKNPKHAGPQGSNPAPTQSQPQGGNTPPANPPSGIKKGSPIPAGKPSRYLECEGVQFKFTPFALPKKAPKVGKVLIDGKEVEFQTTNNKGFTKPDTVINYIWVTLPNGDTGYITLDYNVEAMTYVGKDFTLKDGTASRKDPARVPKDATVGEDRIKKFKETQAKKAADKGTAASAAGSTPTQ